jgi:hypothetical protein
MIQIKFGGSYLGVHYLITLQGLKNYGGVPYKFMWKIKIPMRVKTSFG